MIKIRPSPDVIEAEIHGADLARLPGAEFGRIEATFNRHAVLCFRDQRLMQRITVGGTLTS